MGKKNNSNIGRTLIKDRFKGKSQYKDTHLHTTELNDGYDWNRLNLQSVTEQNTLDEFLATAELAGTEFQAEKLNITFIQPEKHTGLLSQEEEDKIRQTQEQHKNLLSVPRRPSWDKNTSAEELDRKERDSFLEWRRQLAQLQEVEGLILTPFERNLDFWRQLWRVIERSDIVVQILDGRNPLLFRCEDLELYVKEIDSDKQNVLLINKADFLSLQQRQYWADYFDKVEIKICFWSAVEETARNQMSACDTDNEETVIENDEDSEEDDYCEVDSEEKDSISEKSDSDTEKTDNDNNDTIDKKELCECVGSVSLQDNRTGDTLESSQMKNSCNNSTENVAAIENETNEINSTLNVPESTCKNTNNINVLNGDELIDYLLKLHTTGKYQEGVTTIGLIGYPNVGKSSTINAILQTKKVPVSATPGRTKHFQTLYVDKTVMLCDCPGLVMPTFVSTKAEMIISGILPIDQMRDYVPPISLMCKYIPRSALEATYGILLPKPNVDAGERPDRIPTAHELLTAHACMRGYMTHKGVPDFQRSARVLLKDYVTGKLLFCHPPPSVTEIDFHSVGEVLKPLKQVKPSEVSFPESTMPLSSVDKEFFSKHQGQSKPGSKGVHGVTDFTRKVGFTGYVNNDMNTDKNNLDSSQPMIAGKSWKKHGNRNKKEKLRRKNKHLDMNAH